MKRVELRLDRVELEGLISSKLPLFCFLQLKVPIGSNNVCVHLRKGFFFQICIRLCDFIHIMFINTKELISTSFKPSTIEGRINYKIVHRGKSKTNFKEYWFKLTGNLLFYFSLNSYGGIKGNVS